MSATILRLGYGRVLVRNKAEFEWMKSLGVNHDVRLEVTRLACIWSMLPPHVEHGSTTRLTIFPRHHNIPDNQ
jgi:hypothetical protein